MFEFKSNLFLCVLESRKFHHSILIGVISYHHISISIYQSLTFMGCPETFAELTNKSLEC